MAGDDQWGQWQELKRQLVDEMLEHFKDASENGEITAKTRLSLTIGQWFAILSPIVGILIVITGFSWWSATEFTSLRTENREALLTMQHAIDRMDSKWMVYIHKTAAEIKEAAMDKNSDLAAVVSRLEAAMPDEFPPQEWLEQVYLRDLREVHKRLDALEKTPPQ